MAALTATNVKAWAQFGSLGGQIYGLAMLYNVTTADSIDLSSAVGPIPAFGKITASQFYPAGDGSGSTPAMTASTIGNGASGTNNKLTFTLASLATGSLGVFIVGNA